MWRHSLLLLALVVAPVAALLRPDPAPAYDPCMGPRQAAADVAATREREAGLRAAWEAAGRPATLPTPPNRDGELKALLAMRNATSDACKAAAAAPR